MTYNREETWKDLYKKSGVKTTGEVFDLRSFAELLQEKGLKGYDKGEKQFGSPDKDKAKEFNYTYPKNPEAKLDLHGLIANEAAQKVESFVRESRESGLTFVIVVVGMGHNSPDGKSKLRPVVVQKLLDLQKNHRLRDFKSADPKDGGFGALYIYLK